MRLAAVAIAAIAVIAATATPAAAQARPRTGVVERDVVRGGPEDSTPIASVEIDNRLGDIRIEGHDDNEWNYILMSLAMLALGLTLVSEKGAKITEAFFGWFDRKNGGGGEVDRAP